MWGIMSSSKFRQSVLFAMLSFGLSTTYALESLDDTSLGQIVGEGIAIPFEDLRFQMAPTSFIEFTGTNPTTCTAPNTPAGCTYFKRGDIRYYGLTMSSSTSGTGMDWAGTGCTDGARKLGCPMSDAGITNFSNFDNPYLIRVFPYTKVDLLGGTTSSTVLELIGPTNTDTFRWSFWGEIESDRGGGTNAILKNQTMILGKPATFTKSPSIYGTTLATNPFLGSVMQYLQYSGKNTFGMIYNSRLSGDFRFGVKQLGAGSDVRGVIPDFSDVEGLYVTDVNAFLPLGQLNYQTVVFDDTQLDSTGAATNNGNFVVELTAIPNTLNVYNDFYSLPTKLAATGSCNAACQELDRGYNRVTGSIPAHYHDTHGFVEWGYKYPTCGNSNCMSGTGVSSQRFGTTTADADTIRAEGGLSFQGVTSWNVLNNQNTGGATNAMTSINTGSARMTGMNINHLKFTSLGAN